MHPSHKNSTWHMASAFLGQVCGKALVCTLLKEALIPDARACCCETSGKGLSLFIPRVPLQ